METNKNELRKLCQDYFEQNYNDYKDYFFEVEDNNIDVFPDFFILIKKGEYNGVGFRVRERDLEWEIAHNLFIEVSSYEILDTETADKYIVYEIFSLDGFRFVLENILFKNSNIN